MRAVSFFDHKPVFGSQDDAALGLIARRLKSDVGDAEISAVPSLAAIICRSLVTLAALTLASAALADDACLYRPAAPSGLASADRVADYRSTLLACRDAGGADRIAIRTMTIDKTPLLLLADPEKL